MVPGREKEKPMIRVLYHHRKYILQNAWNDLRHRYAGSGMGVVWNLISPLAQILVYTIVFTKIMSIKLPEIGSEFAFPLYLCSGFLPWIAFSECVLRGANSFLENANYLKKMPIPEQVFVAQAATSATISLFFSLSLMFGLAAMMRYPSTWLWLVVPLVAILFQGFGFGVGLLLSSINVFFRDIGQLLGIFLQIWMWITPIVYPENILPDGVLTYLKMNPAYPFIHAIREVFLYDRLPAAWMWWVMCIWAFAVPALGYLVLRKLRPEIRDVL
jgi:lipopolysaccharide transport system permease protein